MIVRSSINIWSSFTVRLSPLTTTFHSALHFPLNITRIARNGTKSEFNDSFFYINQ